MEIDQGPMMRIPLGLSVASTPTLGDLVERAQSQALLVAGGQKELGFIVDEKFVLGAHLGVYMGNFELNAPIPVAPQADFFGHQAERGAARAELRRHDDDEQQAVDVTAAAVQKSSELVDRVADAMGNSLNLVYELRQIEKNENVDTQPARRFIFHKQEGFVVDIDGQKIPFVPHVVRSAVTGDAPTDARIALVESRSESIVFRGCVRACVGRDRSTGIRLGGDCEFRFVRLENWQKVILDAACRFGFEIHLQAIETLSTCTLLHRPADVNQVFNWNELLEQTRHALGEVRDAANARHLPEQRDAA